MNSPLIPTVHTNGTSLDELTRGWDRVEAALYELNESLRALPFNARDYYPKGPTAFDLAAKRFGEYSGAACRFLNEVVEVQYALSAIAAEREARKGAA